MAVIKRINISEFKVVSFPLDAGVQEEYTGTSWQLNEPIPDQEIFGTEDFFGSAQTSVLLVKLESINVSTFLTAQEFRQVPPGQLANFDPNYQSFTEEIGWVELGRSVNSIYYEDCSSIINDSIQGRLLVPGRLPVSRDYFDMDFLELPLEGNGNIPIVSGEGFGRDAVQIIQVVNIYNNLGQGDLVSFGPDPVVYPALPLYGPNEYLPLILTRTGESNVPGPGGFQDVVTLKTNERPVDLLLVNRDDITNPSSVNYLGNNSTNSPFPNDIPYDDGKKLRWGSSRRVVERGFPASIIQTQGFGNELMWETTLDNRYEGVCVQFPDRAQKTEETTVEDVGASIGDDGGIYPDLTPDPDLTEEFPFCDGCPPFHKIPINFPPLDVILENEKQGNYISFSGQYTTIGKNPTIISEYISGENEDNSNLLRLFYQTSELEGNIKDPREFGLDDKTFPSGILQFKFNKKTCTFDIFPAFRDKDGDIPEIIGPSVSTYLENLRYDLSNRFYLNQQDTILKSLGLGSDGYSYFSDGKSHKELLGESVIGCGDPFSFDMIPEVFVELYKKDENEDIKWYRKFVERPTTLPSFIAPERHHDKNYIEDIVRDLTIGIPDIDFITPIQGTLRDQFFQMSIANVTLDNLIKYAKDNNLSNSKVISRPSRWKSTVRPIYHDIWENEDDFIDPRQTSVINYNDEFVSVQPISSPSWKDQGVLGDYENWRKGYGENKNIYDKIDDAISTRIYFESDDDFYQKNEPNFINIFGPMILGATAEFLNKTEIPYLNIGLGEATSIIAESSGLLGDVSFPGSFDQYASELSMVVLNTVLSIIQNDYNRKNPERNSFQPLRIFKKGGVVLESATGLYRQETQPCPIIFLGFNDSQKIFTPFVSLVERNTEKDNLSKLSKEDIVEDLYYRPSNRFNMNTSMKKVESMKSMKKRIKQYGKNPLLDIFYLNIVEKSYENPGISPFRPSSNSRREDWPEYSRGQYPYIFPPLWNELVDAPGIPKPYTIGLTDDAQYGDIVWKDRQSNTIIPLKDRWSMRLETDSDGNPYCVLRDKTPILDIYNSLMEMHFKGVSWGEILKYVEIAKSSVTGGRYNEKINLDTLDLLLERIQSRLNNIDNGEIDENGNYIEMKSIALRNLDWGFIEFGGESVSRELIFTNNTEKIVRVNEIFIEPTDLFEIETDTYGNIPSEMFKIILDENDLLNVPTSLSEDTDKIYKIKISFVGNTLNNSIQPMFRYSGNLVLRGEVDGEEFESKCLLTCMVVSKKITITNDDYYEEPLFLPNIIDCGFVEEMDSIETSFTYSNLSDVDIVNVLSFKIENQRVFIENDNGALSQIELDVDGVFTISKFSSFEIPPISNSFTDYYYSLQLKFQPKINSNPHIKTGDNVHYIADLVVSYNHKNSSRYDIKPVTKIVTIPIAGISQKN